MWAKFDDQFYLNPKNALMDRDEQDIYMAGIVYCNGQLTDGFIPGATVKMLCAWAKLADQADAQAIAQRLVQHKYWEVVDGGFMVHDFLDWNISKAEALAMKIAKTEAGRRGGKASLAKRQALAQADAQALAQAKSNPEPVPDPVKQEEVIGGVNNIADKPAATAAPSQPPLSSGQIAFLKAFNAKRYKNNIQRDAVLRAEDKYGQECLNQFIDWAATKGMAMGQAIGAMEKTLPGWGKPKSKSNGNGNGKSTPYERSRSVLQEALARAEAEEASEHGKQG